MPVMKRTALLPFLPLLAIGCLPGNDLTDERMGTSASSLTFTYVAASTFNKSGLQHGIDRGGIEVVRMLHDPIPTYDANHRILGDVSLLDGITKHNPDGTKTQTHIRIQTLETLQFGTETLFRVWPGGTSNQGWIVSSAVVPERTLSEEPSARAGNGEMCGHTAPALTTIWGDAVQYRVLPQAIQPAAPGMRWVVNASNHDWYDFTGDWDKLHSAPSRAPLMWSWSPTDEEGTLEPDFKGGGVIRTELRNDEVFIPCQVQSIRTALREAPDAPGSKPRLDTARTLSVYAAYGKFQTTTKPMYGWLLIAEQLKGSATCIMHVRCEGGADKCPLVPLPSSCKF